LALDNADKVPGTATSAASGFILAVEMRDDAQAAGGADLPRNQSQSKERLIVDSPSIFRDKISPKGTPHDTTVMPSCST